MQSAFVPIGNTVAITAAATAPTGVQAGSAIDTGRIGPGQYRIVNAGAAIVHLGVGESGAAAAAAAVAATSGTPALGIPLLPGAIEVMSFKEDAYFSGLAASNTTIYITPGKGL